MSDQTMFERTLAALYEAMLDDTHWPATSALIDEACGLVGNALAVGDGPKEAVWVNVVGIYARGERRTDLEREYLESYRPKDERVVRLRQLPDSRLVPTRDLYTTEETKTSATFKEMLLKSNAQDGLNARLAGLNGSDIFWGTANPATREGWGSSQLTLITRLLPHIRQFVRVRQALGNADALKATAAALLENRQVGVIHLDRRGRVVEANDRARHLLLRGDGLSDRDGVLRAGSPDDQRELDRLVAGALPTDGGVAVSSSMPLRRSDGLLPLAIHIKPMGVPQPDYGGRDIAALVLLVEPDRRYRIDPGLVAKTLGLTPMESRVAVWLAEGRSVDDIVRVTGRAENTIYWHLKQIYEKLYISRQTDLVRLVLSIAELE